MATATVVALAVGLLALAVPALAGVSSRVDRLVTRIALRLFGWSLGTGGTAAAPRSGLDTPKIGVLRGAHISETYRAYAAKAYLYAALVGIAGSVFTVYAVAGAVRLFRDSEEAVSTVLPDELAFVADWVRAPQFSSGELFVVLLVAGAGVGIIAAVATYQYRWYRPRYLGEARSRQIEESLPWTIAFIYALSRSGMAVPQIMRILAENTAVYGEAAREIEVAVRDMDVFGTNVISALWRLNERTPSDEFADFAENFAAVLQGGRDTSRFLHEQYEQYQEAAEANQQQFLALLATLAESYVTGLVAGPLFLITILVVIGFAIGNTLTPLRVIVYLGIPLATAGFLVYLDSLTSTSKIESDTGDSDPWKSFDVRRADGPDVPGGRSVVPDGGETGSRFVGGEWYTEPAARNVKRLAVHDRLRGIRDRIGNPVGYVLDDPTAILYAAVPLAVVYVAVRTILLYTGGGLDVVALDDVAVHAVLLVAGPFALVYELHTRRLRAIERAVPDFLDRLASINEAGMPIVRSFERIQRSNLGALDAELRRTWTDVEMGAKLDEALGRLEERIDTPSVSRAVTLITHSMEASGDLAPVLRIAADDALVARRLKRQRRQELLTYMVVIYVAFLVFLAIVVALTTVFIPVIPTTETGGVAGTPTIGGGLSEAQKLGYQVVFNHSAIVQGIASGLVAGKMSEGTIKAGAKHVTVMVAIAYAVVVLL